MKKLVMSVDLEDGKAKRKAMKTVSALQEIDSISIDMKEKKMTVVGTVDPVRVVSRLRKYWQTDIITVGPEKKEEPKPASAAPAGEEGKKEGKKEEGKGAEKKEEGKKEEGGGKKEEGGGGGGKKENGEAAPKKPQPTMPQPIPEHLLEVARARQYNPYMGNYPPYMAMANPYMTHPQMHHQPTYYAQNVEENPNGCTFL